jgi:hypothetical protein
LLTTVGVTVDEILSVKPRKQVKHVDVAIVVNGAIGLIIEDKTVSKEHNDQLKRYLKPQVAAELRVSPDQLHGIYLKTGNEAGRDFPERWSPYMRADLLAAIGQGVETGSDIARDFIERLMRIETRTQAFLTNNFLRSPHDYLGVEGFYQWLEGAVSHLSAEWSDWGYVANASGGFLGFWTGTDEHRLQGLESFQLYLQFHGGDTVYARMSRWDGGRVEVAELRAACDLLGKLSNSPAVVWRKPTRHRAGASAYAAQALFDGDEHIAVYLASGVFDKVTTMARLRSLWDCLLRSDSAH